MTEVRTPQIFIVGAGPGDPDLISLKAMKAIQRADVILYDALVNNKILEHAKRDCITLFVGKRRGKKIVTQDGINELMVHYALTGNTVVRLKGGDPMVFGRGHEEMEYVLRRGINVEIIPGITSAVSGPAAANIPVTKRGVSESFWVITGTIASGDLSGDLYLVAKSSATVVILMGMEHLASIAAIFNKARGRSEPVAVIQHATLPEQLVVKGNTENILALVSAVHISTPAVIVIGKVVTESLHMDFLQQQAPRDRSPEFLSNVLYL